MPIYPSEKLKNKSETIKNWVMTIAIIIGGAWTVYTFWKLDSEEHSKAILDKLKADSLRQAVLKIKLDFKQDQLVSIDNDKFYYISGFVRIHNIGNKNAVLKFKNDNAPFTVTKVGYNGKGNMIFGKQYQQYPPKYAGYNVLEGDSENVPFFIRVNSSGLYHLDFEVSVPNENAEWTVNSWTASAYLQLK